MECGNIPPPTTEVLDQCGLSTIATYIAKRKTTPLNNMPFHQAAYIDNALHPLQL
jgi:hypothetical protein